ncbi:MATE efflux family protein (macronuclear) [Tetrahymena thermophila SB210]|uniref:MATE efflux family protein n=1 Tax=Tetrahymena thermophila (strain SB210) TaxID=312017 RepID=W7XGB9_TETTS|nr:MATE efflux family protein [Tetrahymena thermophila SB210]EWS71914.1 MATE efflux family protein [Tetrahymena thermophila SB210]|eukprot:XP_012655543.1 MATE efflux family protein [Tetrahymena thermophila SB210]
MIVINSKVIDIIKSASFNAISNLCNNLIYLVILHFMALSKNNASLNQNGISISMCIVEITFGPVIQAFSNGLKQLYSQFFANYNQIKGNKNLLLYQSILFCICLGVILLFVLFFTCDHILRFMNYDEEIISMTYVGIVYLIISRMLLVNYEFIRAQLIGLKLFGPFAVFQSTAFGLATFICLIYSFYSDIGIHEAGFFMILHEIIKIFLLSIYILQQREQKKVLSQTSLLNSDENQINQEEDQNCRFNLSQIIQEKQKMYDLLLYVRPLILTLYIEYTFFNTSVILSGRYSKDYIVSAVCFSITNNLILKGILGLSESAISFCGSSFAAKNFESTKQYLRYTIVILLSYEAVFIICLITFSNLWARCFTLDQNIIDNIQFYKYLYLITVPIDGTQILLAAYLQVLEKKVFVSKVALFSYIFVGIPLMFILGDLSGLKLGGLWLAIGISNSINLYKYIQQIQNIDYDLQFGIAQKNQQMNGTCSSKSDEIQQIELSPILSSQKYEK